MKFIVKLFFLLLIIVPSFIQAQNDKHKPRRLCENFSSGEFVVEKMFQKTLWQSSVYSNSCYSREIATPPQVLLAWLLYSGGSQKRDVGELHKLS